MNENRSLTRLNWEFNNYHKFAKCPCVSKSYCLSHDMLEEDLANLKYYNSPGKEGGTHCNSCVCLHLKDLKPGTLVDVYLSNGHNFSNVYFAHLDLQNYCVHFLQVNRGRTVPIMIACSRIDAVRKTNPTI
ncbi:hypothetical protein I6G82_08660 [Lysinibacillus macroides]|uniref:Uncharacterized protein n=1 Tax=Lysinibacillus macroides TaxID=33935 RepID=A0A0N0UWL1_9BACI|nr:hypothetical protein [Lysinibacillus macroides]KOY81527.1 hypothetical protein ADM90_14035 [Lysinibacillus macroides]QPR69638.1 hypothetical protein I6G82_08660 [Lysinibacillus macroides]